jgi:hypothetical protein
VEAVVEGHDPRATGRVARHLDHVLDRLGTGVDQEGALLVVSRGQLIQTLTDLDVARVGGHHEAGVGEESRLLPDGLDDQGGAVAGVGRRDAGAEVDQPVAVDVLEYPRAGPDHEDGQGRAHPLGDGALPARLQLPRARPGDLGEKPALLRNLVGRVLHHRPLLPQTSSAVMTCLILV